VRVGSRRDAVYWWAESPRWRDRLPRLSFRRRREEPVDEEWYRADDWHADDVPVLPAPPVADAPTVAAAEGRMPYLPALDGLRAIALVCVLAFHAGVSWIHGGYLPLTSFFVLSGFLITSLLLLENGRNGSVSLLAFWARRARRLVPAAILALGLVALYTWAVGRSTPGLRGDVFSCLGWVANWRFIFVGRSYEDLFGDPSPVQHFWSLAVEEQFYLLLPPLAVGLLLVARGRRWLLAVVTTLLIAASTVTMIVLHEPGEPPLRTYFGTDTRAAELLVGVLLALVLTRRNGLRRFTGAGRWVLDIAGIVALGVSVWLWIATHEYDDRLYEGGILGIALLAAIVVAAATQPGSLLSRLLGLGPIAALGRISYGVYLFHWPLFLWMNEERTGLDDAPLFALRMAVTIALATLSYLFIEQPIRTGVKRPAPMLLTGWANATAAVAAVVVLASATSPAPEVTLQTASGPVPEVVRGPSRTVSVLGSSDSSSTSSSSSSTSTTGRGSTTSSSRRGSTSTAGTSATTSGGTSGTGGSGSTTPTTKRPTGTVGTTAPTTTAPPRPLKVMVVGDSISVNLGTGLVRHTQKHGDMEVLSFGANGCPVSGTDGMRYPNGQAHVAVDDCNLRRSQWSGQLNSFDPDIVLVESSIFDILDRTRLDWGGAYYHVGDGTFDGWLLSHHKSIVSTLKANGAKVVWATVPCAEFHPESYPNHHDNVEGNRRIDLVNGLIRRIGVPVADLDAHVCPGGSYSSTVDGVGGARYDGVHFIDPASEAIADKWLAPLLLSMR
jgi:peptidoglycan/LPS O-acetylase OafA/YrhL